jgi:hypothetical protein
MGFGARMGAQGGKQLLLACRIAKECRRRHVDPT